MRDVLISMYLKYDGDYAKILASLKTKELFSENEIIAYKMDYNFDEYRTIIDNEYPEFFKGCMNPPMVYDVKDEMLLLALYQEIGQNNELFA